MPRRSRGWSFAGNDLNSARTIDDVSPDGGAEAEAEAKVTAKGRSLHMNVIPIKEKN